MMPRPSHALVFLLLAPGAPAVAQSEACPITFLIGTEELTCTCEPGAHEFNIWGSGPYTGDSPICTAAVHAGVIGPEGGEVRVINAPLPERWAGSTANGITSLEWDEPFGTAYDFLDAEEADMDAEGASP